MVRACGGVLGAVALPSPLSWGLGVGDLTETPWAQDASHPHASPHHTSYLKGIESPPAHSPSDRRCKVVLVGDAGVGKTTLAAALRGRPFGANEATVGLRLGDLPLPTPKDKAKLGQPRLSLTLVDTGGAGGDVPLLWPRSRAVYVVCVSGTAPGTPEEKAASWLRLLDCALGLGRDDLQVVLVATKADLLTEPQRAEQEKLLAQCAEAQGLAGGLLVSGAEAPKPLLALLEEAATHAARRLPAHPALGKTLQLVAGARPGPVVLYGTEEALTRAALQVLHDVADLLWLPRTALLWRDQGLLARLTAALVAPALVRDQLLGYGQGGDDSAPLLARPRLHAQLRRALEAPLPAHPLAPTAEEEKGKGKRGGPKGAGAHIEEAPLAEGAEGEAADALERLGVLGTLSALEQRLYAHQGVLLPALRPTALPVWPLLGEPDALTLAARIVDGRDKRVFPPSLIAALLASLRTRLAPALVLLFKNGAQVQWEDEGKDKDKDKKDKGPPSPVQAVLQVQEGRTALDCLVRGGQAPRILAAWNQLWAALKDATGDWSGCTLRAYALDVAPLSALALAQTVPLDLRPVEAVSPSSALGRPPPPTPQRIPLGPLVRAGAWAQGGPGPLDVTAPPMLKEYLHAWPSEAHKVAYEWAHTALLRWLGRELGAQWALQRVQLLAPEPQALQAFAQHYARLQRTPPPTRPWLGGEGSEAKEAHLRHLHTAALEHPGGSERTPLLLGWQPLAGATPAPVPRKDDKGLSTWAVLGGQGHAKRLLGGHNVEHPLLLAWILPAAILPTGTAPSSSPHSLPSGYDARFALSDQWDELAVDPAYCALLPRALVWVQKVEVLLQAQAHAQALAAPGTGPALGPGVAVGPSPSMASLPAAAPLPLVTPSSALLSPGTPSSGPGQIVLWVDAKHEHNEPLAKNIRAGGGQVVLFTSSEQVRHWLLHEGQALMPRLRIISNRYRPLDGGEAAGERLCQWLKATASPWRQVPYLFFVSNERLVQIRTDAALSLYVSSSPAFLMQFAMGKENDSQPRS